MFPDIFDGIMIWVLHICDRVIDICCQFQCDGHILLQVLVQVGFVSDSLHILSHPCFV